MKFGSIVFGVTGWTNRSVTEHVLAAASDLALRGYDTRILVSGEPRESGFCPTLPENVVVDSIPRAAHDQPADIWLSMARYLEENAPCVYITSQEWFAALIAPRLSNRVAIVGVLYENSQAEYDHCARLGAYWNSVVVLDPVLRQRIIGEYPAIAARLSDIGPNAATAEDLGNAYIELISAVGCQVESGRYRRRQEKMIKPPAHLLPTVTDRVLGWQVSRVNAVPLWPDRPTPQSVPLRRSDTAAQLRDHRIVIAVPTGRVSGVDVFSINLARALIARGYRAELVQTAPDADVADRLPLPEDVPVNPLSTKPYPTWRERWGAMISHLESRGPCIYIPNYDTRHSCVIPALSPKVKTVGIGHSDDAQHYAHILHLASYWDAVVAVSPAIAATISGLAPGIESRLSTIPYGVPVPEVLPGRRRDGERFAAVYAGRIVRFQKRAMDLLSIAECLRDAGSNAELTVAGSGTELMEFLAGASPFILSRHLRYVGGVTNEQVIDLFARSDVFVLPSSFEGLPVSLLEAMAQGCVPIVSAIRSGVPEVIKHGENGMLAPIGNAAAFAERILRLERDQNLLDRMRGKAHATVRDRFGIDSMVSAYIETFERIIREPVVRPRGKIARPPSLSPIESIMPRFPMPLRRVVWSLRRKGA